MVLHFTAENCWKAYEKENAQRECYCLEIFCIMGRVTTCQGYAPKKEVIKMLNGHKDEIYAVRGNCEAEWIRWYWNFRCLLIICCYLMVPVRSMQRMAIL